MCELCYKNGLHTESGHGFTVTTTYKPEDEPENKDPKGSFMTYAEVADVTEKFKAKAIELASNETMQENSSTL